MTSNNWKWTEINWFQIEKNLLKKQQQIYNESKRGHLNQMHQFQRNLLQSFDAKLVAIRQATENTADMRFGIALSHTQKLALASNLNLNQESNLAKSLQPIKKIEKQAKHILIKLALEPQWEALFEKNSKRLGNSHYQLTQNLLSILDRQKPQKIFLIEFSNFSEMDHLKLLTKLEACQEIETQLYSWLNQGLLNETSPDLLWQFMQGKSSYFLRDLLVNIAFTGLEKFLENWYDLNCKSSNKIASCPKVVRYKTAFVITISNQNMFDAMVNQVEIWFKKEIGFLPAKKSLVLSSNGLTFLGFQFISVRQKKGNFRMKMRPSKESKQRFITLARQLIQKNKSASSYTLIRLLSRLILGWANYFYFSECKKDFTQLDFVLFQQIRAWVFRRKSKGLSSRTKLKQKYFPDGNCYFFQGQWYQDNWVLNGQTNPNGQLKRIFLPKMSWVTVTVKNQK